MAKAGFRKAVVPERQLGVTFHPEAAARACAALRAWLPVKYALRQRCNQSLIPLELRTMGSRSKT
jgi:hypothetical protein